jgi:hypothetical protein
VPSTDDGTTAGADSDWSFASATGVAGRGSRT